MIREESPDSHLGSDPVGWAAGPARRGESLTATHWGAYRVRSDAGRVTSLEPVSIDAAPSPIGAGMPSAHDRNRILRPAIRRGWLERGPRVEDDPRGAEPFVEVGWEEALDLIARELGRVRRDHGDAAVYGGSYGWASAGRFHHALSQLHRFLAFDGGYSDSLHSYSAGAQETILPRVIGGHGFSVSTRVPLWEEVAEYGELVVAFGGLPRKNAQSNVGGMGAHRTRDALRRCRAAGVTFVNVGPIADDVDTELKPEWLPLRPNTDTALMLALAHTLVVEDRHDVDFLDRCCVGFDRFQAYLLGEVDGIAKDADWAAAITELDAGTIRDLARRIASHRTTISVSWSVQRSDHGEQPYWAALALSAISGSLGRPGGGYGAGMSSIDSIGSFRSQICAGALPRLPNPVRTAIPVARISDALLHPGDSIDFNGERIEYPDIRLIYWAGGSPFHHQQDLNRLVRAWRRPETVVVHDSYWNPTARFADIVIPVATMLERDDISSGQNDPWIIAMHRAVDPPAGVLTDYEVFARLAQLRGFADEFTEGRTAEDWVRQLYEQTREHAAAAAELPGYDEFRRTGMVAAEVPQVRSPGDFILLREDPQQHPLDTPSGRIELFSATIDGFGYQDCIGHPAWFEPAEWLGGSLAQRFPLHLISNQPRTRLHSQYDHGGESQSSKIAGREPARMNPQDAAARGIQDGDIARLFNDRGACLAGIRLTEAIRPGVVQLSTGAWYDPLRIGDAGSLDVHGNPNVLTLDRGTSRLAQASIAQTCLIEIERFTEPLPPITAYDPPQFAPHP